MQSTPPPNSTRLCLGCRYSLAGLTEPRCPECGRAFDPADPGTWYTPSFWMLHPSYSTPPGRRWWTCAGVAFAVSFGAFACDIPQEAAVGIAILLWLACLAPLIIRLFARVLVPQSRHRLKIPAPLFWRRSGRALTLPLLCAILAWLGIPPAVRFLVSLPSLSALADQAERSPATVLDVEGWRGLEHVTAVFKLREAVAIEIAGRDSDGRLTHSRWSGVLRYNRAGKTFSPVPPRSMTIWPLFGDWYVWRWATGT